MGKCKEMTKFGDTDLIFKVTWAVGLSKEQVAIRLFFDIYQRSPFYPNILPLIYF